MDNSGSISVQRIILQLDDSTFVKKGLDVTSNISDAHDYSLWSEEERKIRLGRIRLTGLNRTKAKLRKMYPGARFVRLEATFSYKLVSDEQL